MEAFKLVGSQLGIALPISNKRCLGVPGGNFDILIRSQNPGEAFATVLSSEQAKNIREIKLENISELRLDLTCPTNNYSRDNFDFAHRIENNSQLRYFSVIHNELRLGVKTSIEKQQGFFRTDFSGFSDNEYLVSFTVRNLGRKNSRISKLECLVIKDSISPQVTIEEPPGGGQHIPSHDDAIQFLPSELVEFKIKDVSASNIYYCFRAPSEDCSEFIKRESDLTITKEGEYVLEYYAVDKANNSSQVARQNIIVFDKDQEDSFKELLLSAQVHFDQGEYYKCLKKVIRATEIYKKMNLPLLKDIHRKSLLFLYWQIQQVENIASYDSPEGESILWLEGDRLLHYKKEIFPDQNIGVFKGFLSDGNGVIKRFEAEVQCSDSCYQFEVHIDRDKSLILAKFENSATSVYDFDMNFHQRDIPLDCEHDLYLGDGWNSCIVNNTRRLFHLGRDLTPPSWDPLEILPLNFNGSYFVDQNRTKIWNRRGELLLNSDISFQIKPIHRRNSYAVVTYDCGGSGECKSSLWTVQNDNASLLTVNSRRFDDIADRLGDIIVFESDGVIEISKHGAWSKVYKEIKGFHLAEDGLMTIAQNCNLIKFDTNSRLELSTQNLGHGRECVLVNKFQDGFHIRNSGRNYIIFPNGSTYDLPSGTEVVGDTIKTTNIDNPRIYFHNKTFVKDPVWLPTQFDDLARDEIMGFTKDGNFFFNTIGNGILNLVTGEFTNIADSVYSLSWSQKDSTLALHQEEANDMSIFQFGSSTFTKTIFNLDEPIKCMGLVKGHIYVINSEDELKAFDINGSELVNINAKFNNIGDNCKIYELDEGLIVLTESTIWWTKSLNRPISAKNLTQPGLTLSKPIQAKYIEWKDELWLFQNQGSIFKINNVSTKEADLQRIALRGNGYESWALFDKKKENISILQTEMSLGTVFNWHLKTGKVSTIINMKGFIHLVHSLDDENIILADDEALKFFAKRDQHFQEIMSFENRFDFIYAAPNLNNVIFGVGMHEGTVFSGDITKLYQEACAWLVLEPDFCLD